MKCFLAGCLVLLASTPAGAKSLHDLIEDSAPSADLADAIDSSERMDLSSRDSQGYAPLHVAARRGRADVIKHLLDKGVSIDLRASNGGYTPLHLAAMMGRGDAVKLLIESGADVNAESAAGRTSLDLWGDQGKDIRTLLVERSAKPGSGVDRTYLYPGLEPYKPTRPPGDSDGLGFGSGVGHGVFVVPVLAISAPSWMRLEREIERVKQRWTTGSAGYRIGFVAGVLVAPFVFAALLGFRTARSNS